MLSIDPANTYMILVGMSQYTKDPESLPELPSVLNNVEKLKHLFTDGEVVGIPEQNILTICDRPNASVIATEIAEHAALATDTLILYYSGHGLIGRSQPTLHLAVQDSTDKRIDYDAISIDSIKRAVSDSPAGKRILILDCCFSGRAIDVLSTTDSMIRASIDLQGTYALASAPATKAAVAPKNEKYTAFTGELIKLIEEGIDNNQEGITLEEMYQGVRKALRRRPNVPEPQRVNFRDADKLIICRNKLKVGEPVEGERSRAAVVTPITVSTKSSLAVQEVHRCDEYRKFIAEINSFSEPDIERDESDLFLLFLNVKSPSDCEALRKYFRTEDFPANARSIRVEGIYDIYGQFDFLVKLRFKDRTLEPVRLIVADLRQRHELVGPCKCMLNPGKHSGRQNRTGEKCLQCGIRLLNVTKEYYPSKWLPLQKDARMTKAFFHVYGWKPERSEKILEALYPKRHATQNVALAGLYFVQQKKECAAVAEYHVGCGGFYDLVTLILQIEKWLDLDAERTTLLVMQAEQEKSPVPITA